MATINARVKAALYCACGSTLVQRTSKDGVHTAECYNPQCPNAGKVFAAPMVQLEEIAPSMEASHG